MEELDGTLKESGDTLEGETPSDDDDDDSAVNDTVDDDCNTVVD